MEERMAEDAAVIEAYLTLPGGRRVALDAAGSVEVREVAQDVQTDSIFHGS